MAGQRPKNIYLYRIVHVNNIEYILKHGIFTKNHAQADSNYINIGDNALIAQRQIHPVRVVPPGGNLGDYVPFYFGPLSPMLLNIKTGYRGISKRSQGEIAYLCCKLEELTITCGEWCFTDGHAKNKITEFYTDIANLDKLDWELVFERHWSNTEDDFDRMRRKQAEFLVKNQVPVKCINPIVVYDKKAFNFVSDIIKKLNLNIKVYINPKGKFYY